MPAPGSNGLPTIVSFYAGDRYYALSADVLRSDCDRLNLSHDIRHLDSHPTDSWADICRKKIRFCLDMASVHPNGIFWVDVDTRILRSPTFASGAYDLGAFLRKFKSFKDFDPFSVARTFVPGFLHFTGSDRSMSFLQHLNSIDVEPDKKVTDDYILEEGYASFSEGLGVHAFHPRFVARSEQQITPDTSLVVGRSGNVDQFKDKVEQHAIKRFDDRKSISMIHSFAGDAIARGKRNEAILFLRQALRIDPENRETNLRLAQINFRAKRYDETLRVLKSGFGKTIKDPAAIELAADSLLQMGEFDRAKGILSQLELNAPDRFRRSREYRIGFEERARKSGIQDDARPQLYWMETPSPGNFGDILNPYLVEKLSGIPPRLASRGDGILAIGSVIKFAKPGTKVWGSGTPRMTDELSADAEYLAVRGPLSAQLVASSGGRAPQIFGDPAMLLPLVYKPRPAERRAIGLIRHYAHKSQALSLGPDVAEIDVLRSDEDDIEQFINQVCACDRIVSTSLHGIITAHAYGIPAAWATFSESESQISGDSTKFRDHFLAVGLPMREAFDLSRGAIADIRHFDAPAPGALDLGALLKVAPFPVLPQFAETV